MEGQALDLNGAASNGELIGSFMEITSASKEEAVFFLESHRWDLDAAVSTFLDNNTTVIQPNPQASSAAATAVPRPPRSPSESQSSDYSPSRSRSRSLSPADAEPPALRVRYSLRSKGKKPGEGGSGVRTLADLNQAPDGDSEEDEDEDEDEDDEAQQYYAAGENSGMPVQAPNKLYNGDATFDQARRRAVERQDEDYSPRPTHLKRKTPFPGVGRTLADSSDSDSAAQAASNPVLSAAAAAAASSTPAQRSARGLVVDSSLPTTSIQLRLADGTRMVSCFNLRHTIRDIRGFIDASRVGGSRNYQLQTMGFPPKQLTDQDQTIEEAGIASSVVIQKL